MIRALAVCCAVLLAGCASPVVTRIDAAMPARLPAQASFTVVELPGEPVPLYRQATDLVAAGLAKRGWSKADGGDYLLSVALSDRPAAARLQAGDDAGKPLAIIGAAPDRTTSKGCAQRDHRLSVVLLARATGDVVYSGSGTEYHCKAALDESMPHLVTAALAGLDGAAGPRMVERKGRR